MNKKVENNNESEKTEDKKTEDKKIKKEKIPVFERVAKCRRIAKLEMWNENEAREIKRWQIKILVNSIRQNEHFLYPIPREIGGIKQSFMHKVLCGFFLKNMVYENENKTVCIAPFVSFQFRAYGEDGLIKFLEQEL